MSHSHDFAQVCWKIEQFANDVMLEYLKMKEYKGEDKFQKLAIIYDILGKMKKHGIIADYDLSTGEIFL